MQANNIYKIKERKEDKRKGEGRKAFSTYSIHLLLSFLFPHH
jgi:hypothetical protein